MRSARQREDHRAALDRRLEQLHTELAGLRSPAPPPPAGGSPPTPTGTRVRPARSAQPAPDEPSDEEAEGPEDAALPVPGRHAARRGRAPAEGRAARAEAALPDAVRPAVRWALGPGHLRVVAVLLVLALLASGWWLLRSRPEALPRDVGLTVSTPSPDAGERPASASRGSGGGSGGGVAADEDAGAKSGRVVVHVAGRVRRPGIVRLPRGARVVDAVEAAGGAGRGVRLRDLNLARVLVDGEQVLVGMPGAAPAAAAPAPSSAGAAGGAAGAEPTALVDLNTADQAQLETLPGVGPVTAGKILAWREEHGRFSAVEELLEVDGIGEVTLADVAPLVTV